MFVRVFAILCSMLFLENSYCNDSFFIARYGCGGIYKKLFTENYHFQNFQSLEMTAGVESGTQIVAKVIYSGEFNVSTPSKDYGFYKSKFGLCEAGIYKNFGNFYMKEDGHTFIYLSSIKYSIGILCGMQHECSYNDNELFERFSRYIVINSKYFAGSSMIMEVIANEMLAMRFIIDVLGFANPAFPISKSETLVSGNRFGFISNSFVDVMLSTTSFMSIGLSIGYKAYGLVENKAIDVTTVSHKSKKITKKIKKLIPFSNEICISLLVSIYEY